MAERPDGIDRYLWLIEHRRMVLAVVAGSIGLLAIGLGWWGVSNTTVVADQLAYIASGSVLGVFLLGVASMSYWAEQRERELSRLTEIEVYLGRMAEMLGLTDDAGEPSLDEPAGAPPTSVVPTTDDVTAVTPVPSSPPARRRVSAGAGTRTSAR